MPDITLIDFQTFIEHSDDMVGIFDPDFRLMAFNEKYADTFFRSDNIRIKIGTIFNEMMPVEKKSFWTDQFNQALKGESIKNEFPYLGTSGESYHLENLFRPVVKNGEIQYIIHLLKVVTLRKKFEDKIQKSERTYRHLASNIPNSDLFLLDEKFNIIIASGTDLKRRGYNPESLVGNNMYDVVAKFGLKLLWEYYDKARNGIDSQVEFSWGVDFYMDDIIPLRDDQNRVNGYIIVSRKITEQKLNEKKLESLNQSKDNILAIVAHDLRAPINTVIGLTELVKNDSKNADRYFDLINRSCNSALGIITGLLDISELDKADFVLNTELIELVEYLPKIIQANSVFANDKELEIEFVSNVSNVMLELNESKFSRVINNLLMNAIKFSHRKEKITLSVNMDTERSYVVIKVQDRGIGIPDSMKSIIFDKFTKASRKGTEGEKSLGLGMSIVKRIVELHNGSIWLDSKENEGTTIFIELPLPKTNVIQNVNV